MLLEIRATPKSCSIEKLERVSRLKQLTLSKLVIDDDDDDDYLERFFDDILGDDDDDDDEDEDLR